MSLGSTAVIKLSTLDLPAQTALGGTYASGLTSARDLKAKKKFLTRGKKGKTDEVNGLICAAVTQGILPLRDLSGNWNERIQRTGRRSGVVL